MADQKKYTQKLAGQKILIIGGSSGLGYSTAEAALEDGASVILSSSNEARVSTATKKLASAYPSKKGAISGYSCNLGDQTTLESNIKKLLDDATDRGTKKLDHIVFTAGDRLAVKKIQEVDLPFAIQAGMVRFFAPLILGKLAPPYMSPGPNSSITLTTGGVAVKPRMDWAIIAGYAIGLQGLTKNLALELKPIRVNLVCPGFVDTELWNHLPEDEIEKLRQQVAAGLPTGECGKPEHLAETFLYLLRNRNSTGEMVITTGGAMLL